MIDNVNNNNGPLSITRRWITSIPSITRDKGCRESSQEDGTLLWTLHCPMEKVSDFFIIVKLGREFTYCARNLEREEFNDPKNLKSRNCD